MCVLVLAFEGLGPNLKIKIFFFSMKNKSKDKSNKLMKAMTQYKEENQFNHLTVAKPYKGLPLIYITP